MEEEIAFEFDKFMDSIVRDSITKRAHYDHVDEMTPQREYIKRYRELPQNKTRWGG